MHYPFKFGYLILTVHNYYYTIIADNRGWWFSSKSRSYKAEEYTGVDDGFSDSLDVIHTAFREQVLILLLLLLLLVYLKNNTCNSEYNLVGRMKDTSNDLTKVIVRNVKPAFILCGV